MDKISLNLNMNKTLIDANTSNSQKKVDVVGMPEPKKGEETDYIVNISEQGKKSRIKAEEYKKAGTSKRHEEWEDFSTDIKKSIRYDHLGNIDIDETFRLDEPETYAKWKELEEKVFPAFVRTPCVYGGPQPNVWDYMTDEEKGCCIEAGFLWRDWFQRRCMSTGKFVNPVTGQMAAIETVENIFSDSSHQMSINFYGKDDSDPYKTSMWKYNTKFSVLLSTDMVNLLPNYDSKEMKELVTRIVDSIDKMKEVERHYEGDYAAVQFGVKFYDDGSITYHASYAGEGKLKRDEVQANSAEELLEILNNGR